MDFRHNYPSDRRTLASTVFTLQFFLRVCATVGCLFVFKYIYILLKNWRNDITLQPEDQSQYMGQETKLEVYSNDTDIFP